MASIVFWMTRALLRTGPEFDEDDEEEGKVREPKSSSPGSSGLATALELMPCWMRRDDLMATVATLVSGSDSDLIGALFSSSESFTGEPEGVALLPAAVVIVELITLFIVRYSRSCVVVSWLLFVAHFTRLAAIYFLDFTSEFLIVHRWE